ncbi:MAG TPA: tRNA uridine-5-carboxymethylaminomethyl(34) synthesis enzyme MnmG, partial [Firmicutes bacterium]|nr:tRNA uridine-5-carboxymethylaminomethyl(34) synthesis enzyme MnmG [Bacillota bacterium]
EYVQELFLRTIPGLEKLEIVRPGYAIEYDALPGSQLKPSLELKEIPGLFAAGQLNGSSGYEEAAAQGLMAGINAALKIKGKEPLILKRSEAYIGVLIDDLVTKENLEPYRVLTSRAEYRLTLRSDNADERLTPYGIQIGLINAAEESIFHQKMNRIQNLLSTFQNQYFNPDSEIRQLFDETQLSVPKNRFSIAEILKRPEVPADFVIKLLPDLVMNEMDLNEVAVRFKYQGYLAKENIQVQKMLDLENKKIPATIDYDQVGNLAREAREKFKQYQPVTLGQASRISGINPADLTALLFYLENYTRNLK